MNTGAPYRSPCGGWSRSSTPGGCFQHWRYSEAHFPVYGNTTTAKATSTYPQPKEALWTPSDLNGCAGGQETVSYNCLTLLPDRTKNLALCQKAGWKGVQARKVWHGRAPLTSNDAYGCTTGIVDAAPAGTHYRTMTVDVKWTTESWTCYPGCQKVNAAGHYHRKVTVNRYSGVATSSDCVREVKITTTDTNPVPEDCENASCPEPVNETQDWTPFQSYFPDVPNQPTQVCGGEWVGWDDFMDFLDAWTIDEDKSDYDTPPTATFAHYKIYATPNPPPDPGTGDIYIEFEVTLSLEDEYSPAMLWADIKELLAEWDLTDDAVYPWRTDYGLSTCPLVTRNEVEEPVSPEFVCDSEDECSWTDPYASTCDGAIRGSPFELGYPAVFTDEEGVQEDFPEELAAGDQVDLPETAVSIGKVEGFDSGDVSKGEGILGTDYTWDEDCQRLTLLAGTELRENPLLTKNSGDYVTVTYDRKLDDVGGIFDIEHLKSTVSPSLHGQWSGGGIPHGATQWTPEHLAPYFPPFAWRQMSGGVEWAQKYAEIKMPWRSQDWFGPSGARRDDQVGANYRWPNAWPIEGDRGATFEEAAGTVTVTLDEAAAYLRAGDLVDFTSADGETVDDNSSSGYEVASVGSGTFTYAGSAPGAGYTRVKSHGAPGYWWHDTDGKGDYVKFEWLLDNRSVCSNLDPGGTVRATQLAEYSMPRAVSHHTVKTACLKYDRCNPAVLCFSPNESDDFANGITYDFDEFSAYGPDEKYGMLWLGAFQQIMRDLWWTPPASGTEDAGGCSTPGADYAHGPVVEARATVPAAWNGDSGPDPEEYYETNVSPAVGLTERPSGTWRIFLEMADMGVAGHDGKVQLPITDMSVVPTDPWCSYKLWLAMQSCICDAGSWKSAYEAILPVWICGVPDRVCSGHYPA